MDHRVSKDMISSGMTPSGEKTQADLGKTQYGSAPSPNRLMDAYKSMYKEENLDEMTGGTPKITRLKPDLKAQADAVKRAEFPDDFHATQESGVKYSPQAKKIKQDKIKKGRESFRTGQKQENVDLLAAYQSIYADTFEEGKIPAGLQAYLDKKKGKKKDDENGDDKKKGKKDKGGKPDFLDLDKDGDKKESMKKASKEKKESVDLLAAYRAVYKHNEGEEIEEKMGVYGGAGASKKLGAKKQKLRMKMGPAPEKPTSGLMGTVTKGLQGAAAAAGKADQAIAAKGGLKKMGSDYLQKNKGNIKNALLGRTAAGTAARIGGAFIAGRMTSEDFFDEVKSALMEEGCDEKTSIKIMTSITPEFINETIEEENIDEAIVTGSMLAGLAAKKLLAGAIAKKVGAVALKKGIGAAAKTGARLGSKYIAQQGGKMAATKAVAGEAGKGIMGAGKNLAKTAAKRPVETALAGSMVMPQGGPPPQADQRAKTAGRRTAGAVTASADLFDIVKGKLLDEGLTEEECNDVMTTLTLDEINETLQLDEISGKLAMKASKAADMKRAQLAKSGDRAGAAAKAAQASRLYKGGAKRNLAKQDLSKPLNPQRTDYPMGKGANYQQKPNM